MQFMQRFDCGSNPLMYKLQESQTWDDSLHGGKYATRTAPRRDPPGAMVWTHEEEGTGVRGDRPRAREAAGAGGRGRAKKTFNSTPRALESTPLLQVHKLESLREGGGGAASRAGEALLVRVRVRVRGGQGWGPVPERHSSCRREADGG